MENKRCKIPRERDGCLQWDADENWRRDEILRGRTTNALKEREGRHAKGFRKGILGGKYSPVIETFLFQSNPKAFADETDERGRAKVLKEKNLLIWKQREGKVAIGES